MENIRDNLKVVTDRKVYKLLAFNNKMYEKVKYQVIGITSENVKSVESRLEVQFSFETSEIKKMHHRWIDVEENPLNSYLAKKGFFPSSSPFQEYSNKRIEINDQKNGFGLNICAKGEVPRKEMFHLDALNRFFLTGEMK